MSLQNISRVSLLILLPLAGLGRAQAQAGRSGMAFLKVGLPAKASSMGDATSSWVRGVEATLFNPAGVARPPMSSQAMVVHREWIQETRTEFLGAAVTLGPADALGFSLGTQTISEIEIRTQPGPPSGTFTARTLFFGLSYARQLSDRIRVGGTAKFLYEKILVDNASGYAFDLGAQWDTPLENMSVGVAVANLGAMSALRSEPTTLPSLVRAGPSMRFEIEEISSSALLAGDIVYVFPEKRAYVALGGEIVFEETLALRSGYQMGSEGRGLSAGAGIRWKIFTVDYAYTSFAKDLGGAHTIGLLVIF